MSSVSDSDSEWNPKTFTKQVKSRTAHAARKRKKNHSTNLQMENDLQITYNMLKNDELNKNQSQQSQSESEFSVGWAHKQQTKKPKSHVFCRSQNLHSKSKFNLN